MRSPALPWIAASLIATAAVGSGAFGRAEAAGPPAGSTARALAIEASPSPLVLSPGGREVAELRVHCRDEAGHAASCALRLGASIGSLEAAREVGPGEYAATWHAPADRFPQVALFVAVEAGGAFATCALPLSARVAIDGTAEPRSHMRIIVDEKVFGPVEVGRRGRFTLWVEVPPGGRAVGISTDRFGNERRRDIDLGLPPFPRRIVAVAPERLVANGSSTAEALLAAVDERGRPERGVDACRGITVDAGELEAPVARGTGSCSARLRAPRRVGRGFLTVRAAGASARVALVPGVARLVFVGSGGAPSSRPERALAEGERRVLQLAARDDTGNAVAGLRLEAAQDRGPALPVSDLGGGLYELVVRAPPQRDRLRLEVRAPEQPEIESARLDIPLVPPPPVELRLVVEPARARRGQPVTVRVLAPRRSPPSGAVWVEANGPVDPGAGSNPPEEPALPGSPQETSPRSSLRRCWMATPPPPRAGEGEFELFRCRVTAPGGSEPLLVAVVDGLSGATVYRRVPLEPGR